MKNLIAISTDKKFFIVVTSYDKTGTGMLKQAGGKWNPEKKFWAVEIAGLNGNYSLIQKIVSYNNLEVRPSAAALLS